MLPDEIETLARADGPTGEVVLRRRGTADAGVVELIVNGVFAMDSTDPSSERALADFAGAGARVLLGGLGLGYTALTLLDRDVAYVDVVELEPALVTWAQHHVTVPLGRVADDPRVRLHVGDVAEVVARRTLGPWDAILLDVDNGPDFLIHDHNASLYGAAGLRLAYDRLAPGGTLAIWCQGRSPELLSRLREIGPDAREHTYEHRRGTREWSYVIYALTRP